MIILEKNNNYIRKVGDEGPWFLNDWRELTNSKIEDGVCIVSDFQLDVEIEGNIMLLNINNLTLDGLQFNDSVSLKNYIINGYN